jgi:YD repeat-containing protein
MQKRQEVLKRLAARCFRGRTDALLVSESYGYDGNSNLTSHTDRRGKVAKFPYDALNRRTFAGFGYNGSSYESIINYNRDIGDRLTSAVDSIARTVTRAYDGLNRRIQEVAPQGTVNYAYDSAGRRTNMTATPAGTGQSTVNHVYTWDNANRLTNLVQGGIGTVG